MTNTTNDSKAKTAPLYSSYTYNSPNFIVRYPHRKRNKLVSSSIASYKPESWLDYGAGDGALIGVLCDRNALPKKVVLYEPEDGMRDQLLKNVIKFTDDITITGSWQHILDKKYNLVTALEVLEHLPLPERIRFYVFLSKTLEINGKCLIEVPVEYGPVLLLKEFGRRYLKKRVSEYSVKEVVAAFFGRIWDSNSRYDINDSRSFVSPHRGFDLKLLLRELSVIGKYVQVVKSPFVYMPKILNQVVLYEFDLTVRDEAEIIKSISQLYTVSGPDL